ncbi:MAG: flagellin modification protein A [Candidatus Lambdaproteobacteria bacterium RIFOXYD2_FULL_50_16]|uniref:Flagellin modification protein A n=1 Tax=Candidatus Lambdaproteobacteria bacterium RIFOXYD2_FULL_50_16 TaxID=1817772 RepID=A0A1F6G855_9PROT|nr:MAG: flagellin modification protein A [Candidatus Lambdaproteobacteria bacterium RIFOXYD2_FULL_50_16]
MRLNQKVIVITGGAGLIGKAVAQSLASEGACVVLADMNLANAQGAASELGALGLSGRFVPMEVNITSKASVEGLIAALAQSEGRIDGLINCAYPRNKNFGRPFMEVEYEDFCENVDLHLGGYFLCCQRFAHYFIQVGKGGSIINLSSIYGLVAPRYELYAGTKMGIPPEYPAIKGALNMLTKYMAKTLKGTGIRVNAVSPGGVLDKQPEVFLERYKGQCVSKGMLNPADLGGVMVFLMSDESQYLNGQNLVVDDGFTL